MRCLALVTDAFGGTGGIAQYNRDFLTALAAVDEVAEIVVLPRKAQPLTVMLPSKLTQLEPRPARRAFSMAALGMARRTPRFDVVFCGHILMAPLGALLARQMGAKLWLQVHGVDAWDQPSRLNRWGTESADLITSVSRYTRDRMLGSWARVGPWQIRVLPNTVGTAFTPGVAPLELKSRYGLGERRVLLTISRLSRNDRYKGQSRVIAVMPALLRAIPDLVYLIGGDGDDVPFLKQLAIDAGVADSVVFAGVIPANEIVGHYRLATAFIMPSTKEGFGIVFLEAASCGIAVIGGNVDGSWDALREGLLGSAINPDDQGQIVDAVINCFTNGRVPDAALVEAFSIENFQHHVADLARGLMGKGAPVALSKYRPAARPDNAA